MAAACTLPCCHAFGACRANLQGSHGTTRHEFACAGARYILLQPLRSAGCMAPGLERRCCLSGTTLLEARDAPPPGMNLPCPAAPPPQDPCFSDAPGEGSSAQGICRITNYACNKAVDVTAGTCTPLTTLAGCSCRSIWADSKGQEYAGQSAQPAGTSVAASGCRLSWHEE